MSLRSETPLRISPKIFGPKEDESLDIEASRSLFHALREDINAGKSEKLSLEQVAAGFLRVANEAMCRPVRTLTEARGFECAAHHLVMFGGAGGQHGCAIANTLGIQKIIIPKLSSLLSAYGMALADVVRELSEPAAFTLRDNRDAAKIAVRTASIVEKAEADLTKQGFPTERIRSETYLNCRYSGTSTQLMIERPEDDNYEKKFIEDHKREFGFNLSNRDILVDDLRVRAVGQSLARDTRSPYKDFDEVKKQAYAGSKETKKVYFEDGGWLETSIVPLDGLKPGEQVKVSRMELVSLRAGSGNHI